MERILVTGGIRCGKSRWAEQHLRVLGGPVTYITPGYPADPDADPEWAARVEAHRLARRSGSRRPLLGFVELLERTLRGPALPPFQGAAAGATAQGVQRDRRAGMEDAPVQTR